MDRPARSDLDALLNALLPFAEQMLKQHGEFYPFGATISGEGQITLVQSYLGEEEGMPDPTELVQLLYGGLGERARRGEIRGGAVCANVSIRTDAGSEATDVVRVSLDHVEHDPLDVFLPYAIESSGDVVYGELRAVAADPRVFGVDG